jgi:outer membrane immunogenic protein
MMKDALRASACVFAIAATGIGSALAADMYTPPPAAGGYKDAPAYGPVTSWTGFYAGINGGYGWSANSDQFSVGLDPKGGFGGGQVGYNWQAQGSDLILGLEADLQRAGINDSRTITSVGSDVLQFPFKSSLEWFGTVRGRFGYASGTSLVYATGGFAFGEINSFAAVEGPLKKDGTATGYVVGGGYEYKLSPVWSVKAEYQYINLGKNDPTFENLKASQFVRVNEDAFHTVRIGLNYHLVPVYEPLK